MTAIAWSSSARQTLPNDVLIVEDDPIIALDCEDTILGFGVKTVHTAGNVARALDMIGERGEAVGIGFHERFPQRSKY